MIHSGSQASSINQLVWLIICVIDYSATIRPWLFSQTSSRDDLFDNDWVTLNFYSGSQASSINQLAWLIIRVIDYSATIRQWLFSQPARVVDYSTMIESHWLFVIIQQTHEIDDSFG